MRCAHEGATYLAALGTRCVSERERKRGALDLLGNGRGHSPEADEGRLRRRGIHVHPAACPCKLQSGACR